MMIFANDTSVVTTTIHHPPDQHRPETTEMWHPQLCQRVDEVTSVAVSTATLQPSMSVKSLGVTLDQQLVQTECPDDKVHFDSPDGGSSRCRNIPMSCYGRWIVVVMIDVTDVRHVISIMPSIMSRTQCRILQSWLLAESFSRDWTIAVHFNVTVKLPQATTYAEYVGACCIEAREVHSQFTFAL